MVIGKETGALKKALVGYGFDKSLMQSIKGDASLRDTVYQRERTCTIIDKQMTKMIKIFTYLLLKTGVHRLSIGFNNGEVKTFSIFDPANMEVHLAENLLDENYLSSNFVRITLKEKGNFIKRLYAMLAKDKIFNYLSKTWQYAFLKRNANIKNIDLSNTKELKFILNSLPDLRNLEGYFLRTVSISLFNSTVAMTFNCDGTQIVAHHCFEDFIKTNF